MELFNFVPRKDVPITDDGRVDVTEHNFPSADELALARRAVDMARSTTGNLG